MIKRERDSGVLQRGGRLYEEGVEGDAGVGKGAEGNGWVADYANPH